MSWLLHLSEWLFWPNEAPKIKWVRITPSAVILTHFAQEKKHEIIQKHTIAQMLRVWCLVIFNMSTIILCSEVCTRLIHCAAPAGSPTTASGEVLVTQSPVPNWPKSLFPPQKTPPLFSTPQTKRKEDLLGAVATTSAKMEAWLCGSKRQNK